MSDTTITYPTIEKIISAVVEEVLRRIVRGEIAPLKSVASEPAYVTIPEFGRRSGLARTRIYNAMAAGHLPAVKVGRRTLIHLQHGLTWVSSQPHFCTRESAAQ